MILLVGGTSESAPLAQSLLQAGYQVMVSLATEVDLDLPDHSFLTVRRGRLDRGGFQQLISDRAINCVVDASHPFAGVLRQELTTVCEAMGVRRIRYERPGIVLDSGIEVVGSHEAAAATAFKHGRSVLLTTGSRYLSAYVEEASRTSNSLFARVLPGEESKLACQVAGLPGHRIEFARGPFSVEQTRELLRRWQIGVLVAKNGGITSGLIERLEAAKAEEAHVVVVRRPDSESGAVGTFSEVVELLLCIGAEGIKL